MNWRNHSLGRLFFTEHSSLEVDPPPIKFFYRHTVFTWLANERANNVLLHRAKFWISCNSKGLKFWISCIIRL